MKNEIDHIVRGRDSGTFFGRVKKLEGQYAELEDVRLLYYWSGAFTLLELSVKGPGNPGGCKFTASVGTLAITDAVELIPCTPEGAEAIRAVPAWKA